MKVLQKVKTPQNIFVFCTKMLNLVLFAGFVSCMWNNFMHADESVSAPKTSVRPIARPDFAPKQSLRPRALPEEVRLAVLRQRIDAVVREVLEKK